MYDLHLGLPDAGGDDHRPVEPVPEAVPVRDLLLRAEEAVRSIGPGPRARCRGDKGMSYTEEDWVDEDATSHRGPDD